MKESSIVANEHDSMKRQNDQVNTFSTCNSFSVDYETPSETESGDKNDDSGSSDQPMANPDEIWVRRSRCLVSFMLVTTATMVGFLTFRFTSNNQQEKFERAVSSS